MRENHCDPVLYVPDRLSTAISWNSYVSERCGNLLISRRFVLGVPGTYHLCYCSDVPFAGPGTAWDMKNVSLEEAKMSLPRRFSQGGVKGDQMRPGGLHTENNPSYAS